jgi:predicted phage baseplate assembly protein
VLDRASGAVRFGDGRRGLVPPLGRGNLRLSYQSGGGVAGNRPAGNVNRLKGTVPYVAAAVLQTEPAEGGAAQESLERVQVRGPRALRHRDRAAAAADFEDLALAATTAVARVRCLPAHDGTDAGRVGLVVVPVSDLAQPKPDVALLEEVHAYVAARLSPVVDLWTVGPDWLAVAVTVEIVAQVLETATDVENAVRERLTAFLHPLTGGFDGAGWAFGRKPYRSDLYALIAGTPGVDHVARLEVLETADEGLARPERFLVYSGDHTITLAGSTDDVVSGGAA